jgi:hypothetical protein
MWTVASHGPVDAMSPFHVDSTTHPGVLLVVVRGSPSIAEMQEFVELHNRAIEEYKGAPYRVMCDLRDLQPLGPEAAAMFAQAKSFSRVRPNFQGSAVLVSSATVAMQHRRTSVEAGVMDSELISDDADACWKHLRRVRR